MEHDAHTPTAEPEGFRRATNLELFLDLVFVFVVTQLATMISHDPTLGGFARGGLVAWLSWWLWSQFVWAGTTVDLEKNRAAQVIVLATVPLALLMGIALPNAYHGSGRLFGTAYMLVQIAALVIQGRDMWREPSRRATFLAYATVASVGPALVAVGGFIGESLRAPIWIVAAIAGVVGAIASGRSRANRTAGEWKIDPGHFSERHALFVIISLGEVLVAAGATAFGLTSQEHAIVGLTASGFVASVLWWSYFAYIPKLAEHALASAEGQRRATIARDMFSFGHFPLVFGLILFAVVIKHVVKDPYHLLPTADAYVLIAAVALVIGGFMVFHALYNRGVAVERPSALVVIALVVMGAHTHISGAVLITAVGVILLGMHALTVRRLERRLAEGRARMSAEAASDHPSD
ncbi:MAG: low temperature requirement protein A [Polyangiaceae bacterium]